MNDITINDLNSLEVTLLYQIIYNSIVDYIPLRLTKSSKYVESMLTTEYV